MGSLDFVSLKLKLVTKDCSKKITALTAKNNRARAGFRAIKSPGSENPVLRYPDLCRAKKRAEKTRAGRPGSVPTSATASGPLEPEFSHRNRVLEGPGDT